MRWQFMLRRTIRKRRSSLTIVSIQMNIAAGQCKRTAVAGRDWENSMAHEEAAAAGPSKLVVKNVGLMLSGDLARPILDADALIAVDGRITAIGRAADLDFSGATTTIDANGVALSP